MAGNSIATLEANSVLEHANGKSEPTSNDTELGEMVDHKVNAKVEEHVEKARRAFALKYFEQAVDNYASALEIMAELYGDGAPESVDLYFAYGKALLENAISQTAVVGKEQAEETLINEGEKTGGSKSFISFSGDAEDEDEDEAEEEDVHPGKEEAVNLYEHANAAVEAEEREDAESEAAEPEDDFNAAWEVLDLARALYEKRKDENDEIKLKLADTYIALGDVSMETEKFDLAISDYEAGATLKSQLLPLSSRQIAEAHYKLSIVLDLTSGRLKQAIEHATKALDSIEARLAELRAGLHGQLPLPEDVKLSNKGKGKARPVIVESELVPRMSKSQVESEIKELCELREELALKVEELKISPTGEGHMNAAELAARVLDRELNAGVLANADPLKRSVINDLTTMVKKKKKPTESNGSLDTSGKRKAEEAESSDMKKARIQDAEMSS